MIQEFLHTIKQDLNRYKMIGARHGHTPSTLRMYVESLIFKPGFQAVFLYRVAHALHKKNIPYVPWAVARFNQCITGAEIEYNTEIGAGLFIAHPAGIVIGRGTKIGNNCSMYQGATCGTKDLAKINFPSIGNNTVLFAGAKVLGDIAIGNNCAIGANSIVTVNVPDGALACAINRIVERHGYHITSVF